MSTSLDIAMEVEVKCECGEWLTINSVNERNGVILIEVGTCEKCAQNNYDAGYDTAEREA